ncbi:MAG: 1-acyl-sn-glycerol-3-phosphate acyltransferase [Myxococcaceae bacterium]|nr:1-acyl-sn-glycerol-3-phosphate acyltransferase [Myxococcaceae bacterium]
MLDRRFFETYRVCPSPPWERAVATAWSAMERLTGTRVRFENLEALPSTPALIATNSTQKYDFMPIRNELKRRGIPTVTVTKGKNYHQPVMAFLLERLGVVPLASRGYLILIDFRTVFGRRPDDAEYRALRSHLDVGTPLPAHLANLDHAPRTLLGYPFDPSADTWRSLVHRVYAAVMAETRRLASVAVAAGHHVQMYPEGTVSGRLGQGRIGAVQLAWALQLPIVPCGMSGCPGAFRGGAPVLKGGEVTVRFGAPYSLPRDFLPPGFMPFEPEHESRHRAALDAATGELMQHIDALLDAPFQRREGFSGDGTRGTHRFL